MPKKDDSKKCGVCGENGAEKQFGGAWYHKKCLKKAKKILWERG